VVNLQVDLLMLDARWYLTHSGLLRVAHRRRCSSITTELVEGVSNPKEGRWVFKASVVKSGTVHFVGYGDANPSNVSALVHGAEMWLSRPPLCIRWFLHGNVLGRRLRLGKLIDYCRGTSISFSSQCSVINSQRFLSPCSKSAVSGNTAFITFARSFSTSTSASRSR
jgi:hypothetical protein